MLGTSDTATCRGYGCSMKFFKAPNVFPREHFSRQTIVSSQTLLSYSCPQQRSCSLIWIHLCGDDDSVTLFLSWTVAGRILWANSHGEFNIFKNVRQWVLLMQFEGQKPFVSHEHVELDSQVTAEGALCVPYKYHLLIYKYTRSREKFLNTVFALFMSADTQL